MRISVRPRKDGRAAAVRSNIREEVENLHHHDRPGMIDAVHSDIVVPLRVGGLVRRRDEVVVVDHGDIVAEKPADHREHDRVLQQRQELIFVFDRRKHLFEERPANPRQTNVFSPSGFSSIGGRSNTIEMFWRKRVRKDEVAVRLEEEALFVGQRVYGSTKSDPLRFSLSP